MVFAQQAFTPPAVMHAGINRINNRKKRDFFKVIYNPLLEKRNDSFSEKDRKDMLRFAEEFGLNELKEKLIVEFNKTK